MNKHKGGSSIIGIILIALGVFFILDNFSLYIINFDIFQWEIILIVIGLIILATSSDKTAGFVLITIGGVFLATDYFDVSIGYIFREFWPIILVLIGLNIIFNRTERKKQKSSDGTDGYDSYQNVNEYFDEFSVFSSQTIRIKTERLITGKITSIFSGPVLDLNEVKLKDNRGVIDIAVICGGIEVSVPQGWNVIMDATVIFGGFDDKRFIINPSTNTDGEPQQTLHVKGLVLFGGATIKN